MPEEKEYLTELYNLIQKSGGKFYFVELSAELETRLERNETPHRMKMKASKRNVEWSRQDLLRTAEKHRLNSNSNETWFENHIKIDNTHLEPDEVADRIISAYHLSDFNSGSPI